MNKLALLIPVFFLSIVACGRGDHRTAPFICTHCVGLDDGEGAALNPAEPQPTTEQPKVKPVKKPRKKPSKKPGSTGGGSTDRDQDSSTDTSNQRGGTITIPDATRDTTKGKKDKDKDDDDDPVPDELPDWIEVNAIELAGTGCPAGTAELNYLHDGTTFELTVDDFMASRGPGIPRLETRKVCQLLFDLSASPGWQYSLGSVALTGDLDLVENANAKIIVAHYVQSGEDTVKWDEEFTGPLTETQDLLFEGEDLLWTPCTEEESRALIVKYDFRVTHAGGEDDVIGSAAFGNPSSLKLKWRPCSPE